MIRATLAYVCIFLFIHSLASDASAEANWPQWRGGQGMGHSDEKGLPVKWKKDDITYRVELIGDGHSSPCIWGEQIFLTSSLEGGKKRMVFCVDRSKGNIVWEHLAHTGEPEATHKMNMFASPTCATDGERVVAFFGRGGMHCYDMSGKQLWSHDPAPLSGSWGTAASPIIVDDQVIQNCDNTDDSFIISVDKNTGKELWRTPRPAKPRGGWSSPVLINAGDRRELVLNGEESVRAYDPVNGEELWSCASFNGRGTPTAVFAHNLIYIVNGKPGDVYAVKPGGSGDVKQTHMAWHTPRSGGRDLPSPIVVGDYLFVCNLRPGTGTCYNALDGKKLSEIRLGGAFSSSPIAANGLIYVPSESGEVLVIKPGADLEVVVRNELGAGEEEIFRASLAASEGQIFCRSNKALYCIGKRMR